MKIKCFLFFFLLLFNLSSHGVVGLIKKDNSLITRSAIGLGVSGLIFGLSYNFTQELPIPGIFITIPAAIASAYYLIALEEHPEAYELQLIDHKNKRIILDVGFSHSDIEIYNKELKFALENKLKPEFSDSSLDLIDFFFHNL